MVAFAFSWLPRGCQPRTSPGLYMAGSLFSALPFAILIHMLFAFPSGRLRSKWDRSFVGLGYL